MMGAAITASTKLICSPLPLPPKKPQTQPFALPKKNPKQTTKHNNNNNSNNQREKTPNKQKKEGVSTELSFIQNHLSGKKKVGTEAGWGQPVILGKTSKQLYLLLSLLKDLLSPCTFSVTYTKKALEKYLKIFTFIS